MDVMSVEADDRCNEWRELAHRCKSEKPPVEVQASGKLPDRSREFYGTCIKLIKNDFNKPRKMSTCNKLDLENTRISTAMP